MAGGVFYSCLLSGGTKTIALSPANTRVSWRQMCFHLVVGWEETKLIKFPGLVPVHRMFLLMLVLCVCVSYDDHVLADSTLTPQPLHPAHQPGSACQGGLDISKAFEGDMFSVTDVPVMSHWPGYFFS